MAEPVEEKTEFIVEVEVTGRWIERYSVKAKSEDEASDMWADGEYIESYEYQPDAFDLYEVYEY